MIPKAVPLNAPTCGDQVGNAKLWAYPSNGPHRAGWGVTDFPLCNTRTNQVYGRANTRTITITPRTAWLQVTHDTHVKEKKMRERKEFFAALAKLMKEHSVSIEADETGVDWLQQLPVICFDFSDHQDLVEVSSLTVEECATLGEILAD